MKKIFFLCCFCISVYAQDVHKLGKVSIEELKLTECEAHPDEVAEVFFEIGNVSLRYNPIIGNLELETVVIKKIKLYKSEGFNYATVSVPYVSNQKKEQFNLNEAFTYNLENGKIEKTKLKNENIFLDKVNDNVTVAKFTFPNIKETSIIEYKYTITSSIWDRITPWSFQENIPVKYSEYNTTFSEYVIYNVQVRGQKQLKITNSSKNENVDNTSFAYNTAKYVLTNVEPLKEEEFIFNMDNYRVMVEHELTTLKFPNSTVKSYNSTWEDVSKFIHESENFGSQLNKTKYFENDLAKLNLEKIDVKEKLSKVFEFAKQKIKWNENYGVFCKDGVTKAYSNGSGNVAEVNLFLIAVLKKLNFNAHPVILTTRYERANLFPSINAFNYVIAGVYLENDFYLLDATELNSTIGNPPLRTRSFGGRILYNKSDSKPVDLMIKDLSKKNIILNYKINEEGGVIGNYKSQSDFYFSYSEKNQLLNKAYNDIKKSFEDRNENIEIDSISLSNLENVGGKLGVSFDFKKNNVADIIGDKIYFNPLLFLSSTKTPFTAETREYPIYNNFPLQRKMILKIEIPEGYAVDYLPKNVNITTENGDIGFNFNISNNGNFIQLMATETLAFNVIQNTKYIDLKTVYNSLIESESEKVVLKKI